MIFYLAIFAGPSTLLRTCFVRDIRFFFGFLGYRPA